MLPKIHRLPLRTEFKKIKLEGRLIQGNFFSLLTKNRPDNQPPRFAFIVSKKISPLATQRNRIRRLLSEAVYNEVAEIKPGFDFVFLIKKAILNKELTEIKDEIKKILLKSN